MMFDGWGSCMGVWRINDVHAIVANKDDVF